MPGSLQRTLQALAYFSAWFEVFSWRVTGTTVSWTRDHHAIREKQYEKMIMFLPTQ
jgi:hypothetical protein